MVNQDKIVLITGASSGIGAATAKEFAKTGALVLLVARNETKLKGVVDEITEHGGKAKYYTADVSDYKRVQELAAQVENELGVPDILINNAGKGAWKFIDETSYEELAETMAVPYFASFYMVKTFLPKMQKRDSGHIVNMTSIAGYTAFPGATAYIASRTAMVGFHNALAADLYGSKIKTSLCYFAKVTSDYWQNNPGSEERLPSSQRLIPIISSDKTAKVIVHGIEKGKRIITAPFMSHAMNFVMRYFPGITRLIMNKTGYKKNK